jgi:hypothetical protein
MENEKQHYKIHFAGTTISPDQFGMGDCHYWLKAEETMIL